MFFEQNGLFSKIVSGLAWYFLESSGRSVSVLLFILHQNHDKRTTGNRFNCLSNCSIDDQNLGMLLEIFPENSETSATSGVLEFVEILIVMFNEYTDTGIV